MGKLREEIVKSFCRSSLQYNFRLSVNAAMDNEFNLHLDESKGIY